MKSLSRVGNFPRGTCSISISTLHIYVSCMKGWNRKHLLARSLAGWLKINSSSRFCAQINFSLRVGFIRRRPSSRKTAADFVCLAQFFCLSLRRQIILCKCASTYGGDRPTFGRETLHWWCRPCVHSHWNTCTPQEHAEQKHPYLFLPFPYVHPTSFFSIFLSA